ncbi:tyrosine-type recombinase/integrase [Lactiplantibacillus pentosus]|uniref:tyrosine-type recombinase/integrase n=1 Tax=Lactiplantibacillus pentosus TaxID=1589 RepID=UPI00259BB5CB|nr:site-specific integrase [Lactiplantibacillus pentosus]WFC04204.1 tyrosine-type recombinase/integrase [Lactiplantibacillus pentosus]
MAYLYKRADGLWHWRINRTIDGQRVPINSAGGFKLKSAAKEEAEEIENQFRHGTYVETTDESFAAYYKKWMETFWIGKKGPDADRHYRDALKCIEHYFPHARMKDITHDQYQLFINNFAKSHAKSTVMQRHNYIKKCLIEAFEEGVIKRNPAARINLTGNKNREKKEEVKFMSLDDFKKIMNAAYRKFDPNSPSTSMIILMGATGLRFEEADGLTWDCVDFKNSSITINKTWDYRHKHDFGPTKNPQSMRTIKVDSTTMRVLKALHAHYAQIKLVRHDWNKRKLVFSKSDGIPLSNNAINKMLRSLCVQNSVVARDSGGVIQEWYTSHALRHTHASLLLYEGRDISYVSKRLGHKDIMTTYNTYTHVIQEMSAREDEALDPTMSKIFSKQA